MDDRDDWLTPDTEELLEAIVELRTTEEAGAFLRDLCTHREVTEMSHRWHIVRLLDDGLPYREIAEKTGASTATVTRVAQWLNHGMGGYRMVLDRMADSA